MAEEDCGEINDFLESKARVSCQTALASLRECVADRKVGGRAKQALKDLAIHSLGSGAAQTMMQVISILLAEGKLGSDERKALRLATYYLTKISETGGLPDETEVLSMLQTCADKGKDHTLRISCIRALGSIRVSSEEAGARAMVAISSGLHALHQRYGSETDKKARRSILSAFGKRSKEQKEEQQRVVLCRALHSAALAKLKQGIVTFDDHLLQAHRFVMNDTPTVRHALSIALISLPVRPMISLGSLAAFLTNDAHRAAALDDPVAGTCLARLCARALEGKASSGLQLPPDLAQHCSAFLLTEVTRAASNRRLFFECLSALSSPGVSPLLQPHQRAALLGAPAARLGAMLGEGSMVLQHAALRAACHLACSLRSGAGLGAIARAASQLLTSPSLSVQGHATCLLAWAAPLNTLLALLRPALARDMDGGPSSRRQTLPSGMMKLVLDALLLRCDGEPEAAQVALEASELWVRENATKGGGGLDTEVLCRVWCKCASLGDAGVRGEMVVDSIVGTMDFPSPDRSLDQAVSCAMWALGETCGLLLPHAAGPNLRSKKSPPVEDGWSEGDVVVDDDDDDDDDARPSTGGLKTRKGAGNAQRTLLTLREAVSRPLVSSQSAAFSVGGMGGIVLRLRHNAAFTNKSSRNVAVHAMGRIAIQLGEPVRISVYEHLVELSNNEALGVTAEAIPYLMQLDNLYEAQLCK